ncbi:hypothetical protein KL86DYS1_20124 [uncultured Dysgonomonas sp.]|uniref:Uncharacterized protein n=1 Tax=uncultured Dysgonomonas sp. TaxID=206096 RepID=A0A212JL56_9BACT|nr:hypothetical protein KL86DYS1_20124 [uncultured Dysgonomonas sp.]
MHKTTIGLSIWYGNKITLSTKYIQNSNFYENNIMTTIYVYICI